MGLVPLKFMSLENFIEMLREARGIEKPSARGQKSLAFVERLVHGKRVRLEYDQANTAIGHRDRYRRTLGYVYLEDGTFLTELSATRKRASRANL